MFSGTIGSRAFPDVEQQSERDDRSLERGDLATRQLAEPLGEPGRATRPDLAEQATPRRGEGQVDASPVTLVPDSPDETCPDESIDVA
jgi:hypothetical protein